MDLLDEIEGTWHIVATTFPMWLRGTRLHPTFTYTRRGDVLEDDVTYVDRRGVAKHIRGVDTLTGPAEFEWRGHGLMRVLTSRWQITHLAGDRSWAVLTFDRTLFTPAGVDAISRTATPDDATWSDIDAELACQGLTKAKRIAS